MYNRLLKKEAPLFLSPLLFVFETLSHPGAPNSPDFDNVLWLCQGTSEEMYIEILKKILENYQRKKENIREILEKLVTSPAYLNGQEKCVCI